MVSKQVVHLFIYATWTDGYDTFIDEGVYSKDTVCGTTGYHGTYITVPGPNYWRIRFSSPVLNDWPPANLRTLARVVADATDRTYVGYEKTIVDNERSIFPEYVTATAYERTYYTSSITQGSVSVASGHSAFKWNGMEVVGEEAEGSSSTATPNEGYSFVGWFVGGQKVTETRSDSSLWVEGNILHISESLEADVTAEARFVSTPTITYDANGGDTTPEPQTSYGTITLPAAITLAGRIFLGWKIGESVYSAGQIYSLVSNVTAIAQWTSISIHNTNTTVGTISLFDITANQTVATESGGWLMYAGVSGHRYRVDCQLNSNLYLKRGVYENGSYIEPFVKTFDGSDIVSEYYYQEKSFYTVGFTASPAAGGNGTVVTPNTPDKTEEGVAKYAEGQAITIRGTANPGYRFTRVEWLDDNNLSRGNSTPNAQGDATLNNLAFNVTAALQFAEIDYSLEADVDEASEDVMSVAITVDGDVTDTANYGDTATFTATMDEGYSFAGWFDGEGTLVSAANPYDATVSGDISLIAKAKVSVSLDIAYPSGTDAAAKTCSLSVNGETAASLPTVFDVILGNSFEYELTLGERTAGANWAFDGWYADPDDATTVKAYPRSGTITPTEAIEMTAKVASSAVKKLKVYIVNIGETTNVIVGSEDVPGAVTAYGGATPTTGSPTGRLLLGSGGDPDPGWFEFSFDGTQYVEVISSAALTLETEEKVFFGYVKTFAEQFDGQPIPPEEEILSRANDKIFLLTAATTTIYAYYGQASVVRTTLAFAAGSNATMGEIAITALDPTDDGQGVGIDADGMGASSTQGKKLKILAIPKNGYRFVGWYLNNTASGDAVWSDADAEIMVATERTIYAFFAQDPHAVYEWEGSDAPKSMEWRSKTYEASKPFSPSACRVDAMGYPPNMVDGANMPVLLVLTVDLFSSPDKAARTTGSATLTNIANQDARRLPVRRMERYMQIEVKSNSEIDAVLVGTSMGGLAQ